MPVDVCRGVRVLRSSSNESSEICAVAMGEGGVCLHVCPLLGLARRIGQRPFAARPEASLTPPQLYDLLLEMGCSPYNAQIVKDLRLGGSEMLELDEDEMLLKLKLGSEVTRKLLTV